MKRIVLFGPPASGKSTLIKLARNNGIEAYDMEELGHDRTDRKKVLRRIIKKEKSDLILYGAANMQIEDFPKGTISVCLLPEPMKSYLDRVLSRDSQLPQKAGQEFIKWYIGFEKSKADFDYVYTKMIDPARALKEILDLTSNQTNPDRFTALLKEDKIPDFYLGFEVLRSAPCRKSSSTVSVITCESCCLLCSRYGPYCG